jgi:hypothetical protein
MAKQDLMQRLCSLHEILSTLKEQAQAALQLNTAGDAAADPNACGGNTRGRGPGDPCAAVITH